MSNFEQKFWKTITWFGELPGILVPLGGIVIICGWSTLEGLLKDPYWLQSLQSGGLPYSLESVFRPMRIGFGGVFLSYSIGTMIKYFYYKPRPIPRDTSTLWKRINAGSMPSIHASNGLITAIALVLAIFALPINLDQYPGSMFVIYGGIIIGFFYYLSIVLSRIALSKHYPIDTLAGSFLGMTISVVMRHLGYLVTSSNTFKDIILFFF